MIDKEMRRRVKESFSTRLLLERHACGWTQQECAGAIGVSVKTVQIWEKGIRIPKLLMVIKVAETFGVSLLYLLGLSDDPGDANNFDDFDDDDDDDDDGGGDDDDDGPGSMSSRVSDFVEAIEGALSDLSKDEIYQKVNKGGR